MIRRLVALSLVLAAGAQPHKQIPNTPSKHDERRIEAAFKAEVIDGIGCWWEGDEWAGAAECCGCEQCNK